MAPSDRNNAVSGRTLAKASQLLLRHRSSVFQKAWSGLISGETEASFLFLWTFTMTAEETEVPAGGHRSYNASRTFATRYRKVQGWPHVVRGTFSGYLESVNHDLRLVVPA